MIFIWSNDGGPLQYAGLCLFALQFLLPQIMNVYSTTLELQYHYNIPIISVTVAFVFIIVAIAAVMVWMIGSDHVGVDGGNGNTNNAHNHHPNYNRAATNNANSNNNNNSDAPLGSASNPIVVDDDDDDEDTNNTRNNNNANADFWARNNAAHDFSSLLDSANNIARRILQNLSPIYLMIAAGFILPISMMIPILRDGGASALWRDSNTLQLSLFAFLSHSFMAVGAYRILRQVLNSNGADFGTFPGMRRGGGGRRRGAAARRYTVGEIESMLRKVPVEEFVAPEELRAGACSISKMKRMLVNRGASKAIERCIDKSDLLEEIEKVRKYNEECTICAESYQEGDPLRVLKCQHEFHLHCFDRWIYTFATDPRRGNSKPSCPLCKTALCD